jgi:hypothetical protein
LFCAVSLVYASAGIHSRGAGSWSRLGIHYRRIREHSTRALVIIIYLDGENTAPYQQCLI